MCEMISVKMLDALKAQRSTSANLLQPSMGYAASLASLKPAGMGVGSLTLPSTASSGKLLKGSASVMGRERARTAEVLMTLEANSREMAVQRAEIVRLREQVHYLSGQEGTSGSAAERPQSVQERPLVHSPLQRQPRAASAMD